MNVTHVMNEESREDYDPVPRIGNMKTWQTGYTVPWAYDKKTKKLSTRFPIHRDGGGTCTLFVVCVGTNMYVLDFDRDGSRRADRCPTCHRFLYND